MKRLLDIFNKKGLIKAVVLLGFIIWPHFVLAVDYSKYCGFLADQRDPTSGRENFDSDVSKEKLATVNDLEEKIKEFCKDFEEKLKKEKVKEDVYRQQGLLIRKNVENFDSYNNKFDALVAKYPEVKQQYETLKSEYEVASAELKKSRENDEAVHAENIANGIYQPCGQNYPKGCPEGQQCYKYREMIVSTNRDAQRTESSSGYRYKCLDPSSDEAKKEKYTKVKQGEKTDEIITYTGSVLGNYTVTKTETGDTKIESLHYNGGCNIQSMRERYQSKCYSCVVIKTLMETFLNACSKAYDVTSEAGVKLLVLGALIWMAFFVMKNVSSLSSIEPGAMMNTLAVFLFKVMVAYILITSGLGVLIKYTINPLLTAGADMGIAFTDTVSNISKAEEMLKDREKTPEVKVPTVTVGNASTEIVPAEVLNKVMLLAERLDKNVSTNLVIGHAVTCWSMKGGAWTFNIFGVSSQWTTIKVINLWLWFCGALIWFVGFMLTLGIGYYLLDISFKLGFSIMALPVAIGLWPFNITKGTVTKVISIMLKAAGTFVFLGLTTSYALAMISFALRDVNVLFDNVEKGNAQWISETFELTGPYFLIILFAFLYSMKLISSTISDYVNQFFADSVFGDADPMHKKLTQATDFAKQQLMKPVKKAVGKISNEVGEQAKEGAVRAGKFVRGLFKGKANGDVKSTNRVRSGGGGNNPMSNAGKATKAAGATAEQTGKGVQAAGKGAEVGGKAAQAGGKGIMSGGKSMVSSGATMCGTGVGAIVGVPMMIAGAAVMAGGAATYAAGKCAEVAGKAAQKAGKAIQKGGKAMKKAGEKMEKAGAKMEKLGNKLKFGDEKAPKPESEGKPDENNEKPTAQEEKPNKENQTDDKKAAGGKNEK